VLIALKLICDGQKVLLTLLDSLVSVCLGYDPVFKESGDRERTQTEQTEPEPGNS